jgi:hypothetical protein
MVARDRFPRRSIWHFLCIFSFSILFAVQLPAQTGALQDELNHSLSGTTLISTILLGGRAIPHGQQADYPVTTLVAPDSGEVSYRVEWGLNRTNITAREMHGYFDRGTSFHVRSVELKADSLELKLDNPAGDSARLQLILGAGWQSRFDSASIQTQLARIFVLDHQPQPKQRIAAAAGFGEPFSPAQHNKPASATPAYAGFGSVGVRPVLRQE